MTEQPRQPRRSPRLFGRGDELEAVEQGLTTDRLVVLVGVGGIGKTRLADEVVKQMTAAQCYPPQGIRYAALDQVNEAVGLAVAVAHAVGVHSQAVTPVAQLLRERLANQRMLIVLDNAEHLINPATGRNAVGELAADLLAHCPRLHFLVTSRTRLDVVDELVIELSPLKTPHPQASHEQMLASQAMAMLAEYTRRQRAGLVLAELGTGEIAAAASLCRKGGGIPLYLVHLAVNRASRTFQQILADLLNQEEAGDLGIATLDIPTVRSVSQDRHRSMVSILDYTYSLLPEAQQVLWARLSIFAGPFDLDAARGVCAGGVAQARQELTTQGTWPRRSVLTGIDLPAQEILPHLTDLVDQFLLQMDHRTGRYRMMVPLREYGLLRLREAGQEELLRDRHWAFYYSVVAHNADSWACPDEVEIVVGTDVMMPQIRAALSWCASAPERALQGLWTVVQLARTRWPFRCAGLPETIDWIRRFVDAAHDADIEMRLAAMAVTIWMMQCQGRDEEAVEWLNRAGDIAEEAYRSRNHPKLRFVTATSWTHTAPEPAQVETMLKWLRESYLEFAAADNPTDATMAWLMLAISAALHAPYETAKVICAEHLAGVERMGAPWSLSWAQWATAIAEMGAGHHTEADLLLRKAIVTAQTGEKLGEDWWGLPWLLEAKAWVEALNGRYLRAAELLAGSLRLLEYTGVDIHGLPPYSARRRRAEELCTANLPAKVHADAWARGESMSRAEILALAAQPPAGDAAEGKGLTPREIEVLDLLEQGLSYGQIAEKLSVGRRTVETHVYRLTGKLGVSSREDAAQWRREHPTH
ncbi:MULTISPECIES: LuxR C-terminal-related transcriptional regulator [unclassified Crossiella]|uniref:ATP-binding protein n=1 Tax=unclassified Crossiella TaxID=2620835 RepID=UPI001FFE358E|nr:MULTISPECIES: LuxR C-terminal-related transcriptional regulator [unclassified Crossiella]MCK2240910.1 LuxR C-terminal-related transcriptional regulator [Crossiella sp. S99.2]MCK2253946.1 LuxR C-terminal-related transcriptional regulator [Crossiella sp. S99.1]